MRKTNMPYYLWAHDEAPNTIITAPIRRMREGNVFTGVSGVCLLKGEGGAP